MSAAGVLWHFTLHNNGIYFWKREFVLSAQMFQGLFILIFISSFAAYGYSKNYCNPWGGGQSWNGALSFSSLCCYIWYIFAWRKPCMVSQSVVY